jgi:predicted transcriptional regulator
LEYAVLATLWDLRAASIRALYDRVGAPADLVYTTIAKVVDRLRVKGLIERQREDGVFIYRATTGRGAVERARARQLVRRFAGSAPRAAAAALVEAVDELDPELLEALEHAIRDKRSHERGT